MNTNVIIAISAIMISGTIYFTSTNSNNTQTTQNIQANDNKEYKELQAKILELQSKILNMNGKDDELSKLKEQLANLNKKLLANKNSDKKAIKKEIEELDDSITQIKGHQPVYSYLAKTNSQPIHNDLKFTKNNTPYIVYTKKDPNYKPDNTVTVQKEVSPPITPVVSSLKVGEEVIYYPKTNDVEDVAILTVSKDGEEKLTTQTQPKPKLESSPPIPPGLFNSNGQQEEAIPENQNLDL